jgi:hypothetical protein
VLEENGFNINQLRDNRYDAVLHMVTAADGAPEFYNSDASYRNHGDINSAI